MRKRRYLAVEVLIVVLHNFHISWSEKILPEKRSSPWTNMQTQDLGEIFQSFNSQVFHEEPMSSRSWLFCVQCCKKTLKIVFSVLLRSEIRNFDQLLQPRAICSWILSLVLFSLIFKSRLSSLENQKFFSFKTFTQVYNHVYRSWCYSHILL